MTSLSFSIRISTRGRTLVDIRDFHVPLNRVTFLFGESGIGKSLIARAAYGLLDPDEFSITINGEPYETYLRKPETVEIKRNSFYVFQEPSSHLNPLLPLKTQLSEGSLSEAIDEHEVLERLWEGSDPKEIEKLLEVYPKPHRPSGGEKQRMFLVMALKKMDIILRNSKPHTRTLFVFDEPTGSLDNHFRDVFLSLLFKRFQKHNFTTLLITHDYSMVSEVTRSYRGFADRISFEELYLHHGRLALREFQPETYLRWLNQQKSHTSPVHSTSFDKPLVRVESAAEVFGQRLVVSRDSAGIEMVPLEILPGTIVYLKAPSGTGKTTFVKMMMGLVRGERLRVTLDGTVITERTPRRFWQEQVWGKKMTMVFQHADEALNHQSTVRETFHGLPARKRVTTEDIWRTLADLFDEDIIEEIMDKQVSALSGGQKQRLNLSRSLFLNTDILILDEPLNGLDFESTTRVLARLEEKQRAGKGALVISHNEEIFDALVLKDQTYYLSSRPVEERD